MLRLTLLAITLSHLIPYIACLSAGQLDEVLELPGLAVRPSFRHFSGYLNATNGRHLHYWFVESQSNPATDPVVLWLNGGPGCSSLIGFLTENGPWRVAADGQTLVDDPYSWNTFANNIFLESPAGVGYSYADNENDSTNDDQTARDNHLALIHFFDKFPQYRRNKFYITGESYCGVYIPMLALEILRDKGSPINLKGVAIGNGYVDEQLLLNSRVYLAHYHGIIDTDEWSQLLANCCACDAGRQVCSFATFNDSRDDRNGRHCRAGNALRRAVIKAGLSPYFIYDDCPPFDDSASVHSRYYHDMRRYFRLDSAEMNEQLEYYSTKATRDRCLSDGYMKWINSAAVRRALHVPDRLPPWHQCSNITYDSQYPDMRDNFVEIISNYSLDSFIVYNGDSDLVCDYLGVQQFVDGLGLHVVERYRRWTHDGLTAGFVKRFRGLSYVTVRGAGHMVPTNKPGPALRIVEELVGRSTL